MIVWTRFLLGCLRLSLKLFLRYPINDSFRQLLSHSLSISLKSSFGKSLWEFPEIFFWKLLRRSLRKRLLRSQLRFIWNIFLSNILYFLSHWNLLWIYLPVFLSLLTKRVTIKIFNRFTWNSVIKSMIDFIILWKTKLLIFNPAHSLLRKLIFHFLSWDILFASKSLIKTIHFSAIIPIVQRIGIWNLWQNGNISAFLDIVQYVSFFPWCWSFRDCLESFIETLNLLFKIIVIFLQTL